MDSSWSARVSSGSGDNQQGGCGERNPQGGGGWQRGGGGEWGVVAVILQAQSEPKWSRGLMQCNSTPSLCSTQHPGHRAGLLPNRLLNPFRVCVCARLPWPSFAHHCTNQPQRQQLQGAPLLTWAGEAVILNKRSANTELSVLNRDHRASTCLTLKFPLLCHIQLHRQMG